jgi:hypothetical protein
MSYLTKKLKIEDLDKKLSFVLMYRNEINYAMIVVGLFMFIGAINVDCIYISGVVITLGLARVYDQCRDNDDEVELIEAVGKLKTEQTKNP